MDDFCVLGNVGKGNFGRIFKVRRLQDNRVYVLKRINLGDLSESDQRDAIQEVQLMARLNSPYVVKYYDSFIEDSRLHIIMEYCEKGDLHEVGTGS